MIDDLGKKLTENMIATITTIAPGLEATIVNLLHLLPHLNSREVTEIRAHTLHLPKECYYHVKEPFECWASITMHLEGKLC